MVLIGILLYACPRRKAIIYMKWREEYLIYIMVVRVIAGSDPDCSITKYIKAWKIACSLVLTFRQKLHVSSD